MNPEASRESTSAKQEKGPGNLGAFTTLIEERMSQVSTERFEELFFGIASMILAVDHKETLDAARISDDEIQAAIEKASVISNEERENYLSVWKTLSS